eukprot:TRINITY_DN14809_c0_g1_i1.p1 TRINITY_DN14809_c0_g1~~TRINITY_DN14809_c0_g1_i1.p1  ORF type:complete len:325 (+),score=56.60 TRINITY_DN14809_c0_g1_i1:48-977(+)
MSYQGVVRSFNSSKGWGFIECNGQDIFVHIKDCKPTNVECVTGGQPQVGDVLVFELEPRASNPGHLQAKNVSGGTAERFQNLRGAGTGKPVPGDGEHSGRVKCFGAKGIGWITLQDGTEAFMHKDDCVGSRPITGDLVQFDLVKSETKPGKMQAKNITGGSAPIEDMIPAPKEGKEKKDLPPHPTCLPNAIPEGRVREPSAPSAASLMSAVSAGHFNGLGGACGLGNFGAMGAMGLAACGGCGGCCAGSFGSFGACGGLGGCGSCSGAGGCSGSTSSGANNANLPLAIRMMQQQKQMASGPYGRGQPGR